MNALIIEGFELLSFSCLDAPDIDAAPDWAVDDDLPPKSSFEMVLCSFSFG